MIIFITNEKDIEDAKKKFPKGNFISISDELDNKGLLEGRQFLPLESAIAKFIEQGDADKYEMEYSRYLSDPRVFYMLILHVYRSSTENVFFVCSEAEKEFLYPKFLKNFIIDTFRIDKKFVVSYKKFDGKKKSWDEATIKRIASKIIDAKCKAVEAYRALQ